MEKLDKSKMSIDERADYEMMMARNASIIEILKEKEKEKIADQAEKRNTLKTAKKLKDMDFEIDVIMRATNLTKEEIDKL